MDENSKPKAPANLPTEDTADTLIPKVFEVSADLEMKEVSEKKESESENTQPVTSQQLPKTQLQDAVDKIGKIPLQDFSAQLRKAQMPSKPAMPTPPVKPPQSSLVPPSSSPTSPSISTSLTPVSAPNSTIPVNSPQAEKSPTITEEKFNRNTLRTYESDVANFMSHKKTSVASIAMAEHEKQGKVETLDNDSMVDAEARSRRNKKIFITIISLTLIVAGIIGGYYFYSQSVFAPVTIVPQAIPVTSPIPSNAKVLIAIDGLSPLQIVSRIRTEIEKPQTPNTIKEIIFTKNNGAQTTKVGGVEMLNIMGIDQDAPDMLIRTLTPSWMFGEYFDTSGNKDVFVVFTHNYFQNAFAGMLSWENFMADDLKQYIGNTVRVNPNDSITSTSPDMNASTSTTLESVMATQSATSTILGTSSALQSNQFSQTYFSLLGHFTDGIIKNKDAREFKTDMGNVLFLYSFVDNTKLILTSRETTLAEIISRLEQQTFVR